MIQITDAASLAIKEIIAQQGIEDSIRVVMAGGCSGASLGLTTDKPAEDDLSHDHDGVNYIMAKDLNEQVGQVTVDWIDDDRGKGLLLTPEKPLAQSCCGTCSCG